MRHIRAVSSHGAQAVAEAGIIALIVLTLLVAPALAAKGGNGGGGKPGGSGSSTVSLLMVTDGNGNGTPNYSDVVTFQISTSATDAPYVNVTCSQNGNVVYGGSAGFFVSYPWPWTRNFTLSSSYWSGGAADCAAELYLHDGRRFKTLATMTFRVEA